MRERMTCRTHVVLCVLLLFTIVMLESWSELDMWVQRLLYSGNAWVVAETMHTGWLKRGLYTGPKLLIAALGVLCVLGACAARFSAWGRRSLRHLLRPCLFLALSLALIPLLVASGKQITNIYCPYELVEFGGTRSYQRLMAPVAPENTHARRGKGFPAGHASGGFALMGFYFISTTLRRQCAGLAAGLAAGWIMGLYQMLRGEHFLSHTLFSMVLAWLVLYSLDQLILHPKLRTGVWTDAPAKGPL